MNININRFKVILFMISIITLLIYSSPGTGLAQDIDAETRTICKTIMSKIDTPYEDWKPEEQKECWSCLEEYLIKAILEIGPDSYGKTLYHQDKKGKPSQKTLRKINNKIRTYTKVIELIGKNVPFEVLKLEEQVIYLKTTTAIKTDLEDTVKNFQEQLASSREELSNSIEGLAVEIKKNKDTDKKLRKDFNPKILTKKITDNATKQIVNVTKQIEAKSSEIKTINERISTLIADVEEIKREQEVKSSNLNIVSTNTSATPSQDSVSGKPKNPSVDGTNRSMWWILRGLNWLIPPLIIFVIALAYILIRILYKQDDSNRDENKDIYHGSKEDLRTPSIKTLSKPILINWWNENGDKNFNKCAQSIKMEFGKDLLISCIQEKSVGGLDWKVIFMPFRSNRIALPAKGAIYDDAIKKWFKAEGDEVKHRTLIVSLKECALVNKNNSAVIEKGTVEVKEDKTRVEENQTVTHKQPEPEAPPVKSEPNYTPFTEENLIEWWNIDSLKTFSECKKNIKNKFGDDVTVEAIDFNHSNSEEWYLMLIFKNSSKKTRYVIPRRFYFTIDIQKWFDAQDGSTSRDVPIKSLNKLAKMKSGTTPEAPSEKGEVTLTIKKKH